MKDRTKYIFAEKIQQMAKRHPIRSIQVKELCEECHMDRTAFYYHFRDKYDLVAWIFERYYRDAAEKVESINNEEMICKMLYHMRENRAFFLDALQDHNQNNLRQYMLDFYITFEKEILCRYLNTDSLSEEMEYMIKQYSFGCMGHTIDWLLGKNDLTPEKMAKYQYKFMPEVLKQAMKTCYDR